MKICDAMLLVIWSSVLGQTRLQTLYKVENEKVLSTTALAM